MKKSKGSSWFLLFVFACFILLSAVLFNNSWSSVPTQTVTLQPGPGSNDDTDDGSADKGKDAGFDLSQWTTGPNDGDGASLRLFNSNCNELEIWSGFLSFSLNGMPRQNISKAEIQVYSMVYFNGAGSPWSIDPTLSVYRLTQSWTEMTVAKNSQPTYDPTALDSRTIDTVGGGYSGFSYTEFQDWLSFDITDLYKGWVDGSIPNHGITFRIDNASCPNGDLFDIFSSDYLIDPTLRPKLVITAECVSPPSNMVSWWSGDGHAFDLIGSNDGTLVSGATYTDGLVGKSFSFDGSNDYVEIPDGIIPSNARNFTVDAWVYANSINGSGENHIVYSGPSGGGEYYLATRNGTFEFAVFLSSSGWQRIGVPADTGTWRHVTGVRRGDSIEIWVNGALRNSMPIPDENLVTGPAVHSSIGAYNRGEYGFWDGLIDEVEIFDRALTQTEIQSIYNAGAAGKCKPCFDPPSDMVSWWAFDEETGTTAHDLIGSNDGTVNGAEWSVGKVSGALSFDGVNDYVFVSNTLTIDGGSQATYDAWVFPESVPDVGVYYGVVGAGDSTTTSWTTQQCRLLYWRTASLPADAAKFYMDCGTDNMNPYYISRFTSHDYPVNNWHSVAGVFNNGSLDIYVNGVLDNGDLLTVNTVTTINTNADNYVWIGAQVRSNQSFVNTHFDGLIDEVEIFNRALSAEEIAALYASDSAGKCKPDADSDGIPDATDNCPNAANLSQEDADSDGIGDACDNCPSVSNPDQHDSNHNGIGDACENGPDLSGNWQFFWCYSGYSKSKSCIGVLKADNIGDKNAGRFAVSYYLSDNGTDLGTLIRKNTISGIRSGRSYYNYFGYNSRTSLSGKYVIAVIDSDNQINERDENNNRVVRLIP